MSATKLRPGARRIRLVCRKAGETWTEDYVDVAGRPEEFARGLVEGFNASLREGELAREVVGVELDAGEAELRHAWRKTNLVTLYDRRNGYHDTYACEHCGATGKRFGFDDVRPDRRGNCPGPRLPTGSTRRIRVGSGPPSYVDARDRTLFVATGIGANPQWMTFWRRPTGSKRRIVSKSLPPRGTRAEAQADLDRLAAARGWGRA